MIYSDFELSKRIELTEARVNADFIESHARLAPKVQATWMQIGGVFVLFDGVQSPCTQTFGLGMNGPVSKTDFDQIEAFFKERKAPLRHEVSPLADASLLPELRARHYFPLEYANVMFKPLEKLPNHSNTHITTRLIEKNEHRLWAETSAKGWSEGNLDFYPSMVEYGLISANCTNAYSFFGETQGKPISTGALFIFDKTAALVGASTVLEGRKQGAQTALLDARLAFAYDKGCTIAIMCALPGSQSQRNAEKNGFRTAYTRTKWFTDHP